MSQATKENDSTRVFISADKLGGLRGQGSFDKGVGRPKVHEL